MRRVHWGVLGVVAVAVAGAGVGLGADSAWRRMTNAVQVRERELASQDDRRPPLHGPVHDGAAFVWYGEALELAAPLRRQDAALVRQVVTDPGSLDPAARDELFDRWQPVMQAITAAAHCGNLGWTMPERADAAAAGRAQDLLTWRDLVNVMVGQLGRELEANRGVGAVAVGLDALTGGVDLLRSPLLIDQMIGCALIEIAGDRAWTDARLQQLDGEALQQLRDGLARADELLLPGIDLRGEVLWAGRNFGEVACGLTPAAWAFGFSGRWMAADAVLQMARLATALDADAAAPWPRRAALLQRALDGVSLSGNPIVAIGVPNVLAAEQTRRGAIATLRLLRLAVAWHLHDDLPTLADPLGPGDLAVEEDADAATFRSSGERAGRRLERRARRRD